MTAAADDRPYAAAGDASASVASQLCRGSGPKSMGYLPAAAALDAASTRLYGALRMTLTTRTRSWLAMLMVAAKKTCPEIRIDPALPAAAAARR